MTGPREPEPGDDEEGRYLASVFALDPAESALEIHRRRRAFLGETEAAPEAVEDETFERKWTAAVEAKNARALTMSGALVRQATDGGIARERRSRHSASAKWIWGLIALAVFIAKVWYTVGKGR